MLKNIGSNWTLNVVQILVFMVLARFTLDALGSDVFGIWEVIVATAGPLQLMVLGVPMATVRAVSAHVSKGDHEGATRALGTSVSLTLALGVVALAVGALLYGGFDAGLLDRWELSPERLADARLGMAVILLNLALGFALRLPYAVFDAHHDFIARNLVMAGGFLAKLGLTVALLTWRADLVVLAAVQVAVALLEFAVACTLSRRRHAPVRFRPGRLDWPAAKDILSFSVFAFLLNMGALLAFRLDAVVIGAHYEAAQVTVYGLGNKIFDPFINLLLAIGMVVMPMATSLGAQGKLDEVRHIFLKWSKVAATLVLMVGGYLLVAGPGFLRWWLGPECTPESGRLMQVLMLSFFLFLPVRGVALPVLMGLGRPRGPAVGLLGMGLANLAISLALVGPYGLMGVALGTAIPNVIFGFWFAVVACRELNLSPGEWFAYSLGRGVPAALLCAAGLVGLDRLVPLQGFWPLFLSGLGYVGLFGLLQVLFVYRGDRYLDLYALVSRRLRPSAS